MTLTEKADKWLTTNDFIVMGCEREAYIDGYRQALTDAVEAVQEHQDGTIYQADRKESLWTYREKIELVIKKLGEL
jgi:hypothetical protein